MDIPDNINPLLRQYVENAVIPRYDAFDKGHQRDHAEYVIGEALKLSRYYDVNPDMVYAAAQSIKDVDCKVFSKLITNPDIQLVDCRTPEEYAEGHINGTVLIDYKAADFKQKALDKLTPEKEVAIYCRSGRRSRAAAEILAAEGYTLFNLPEGIMLSS